MRQIFPLLILYALIAIPSYSFAAETEPPVAPNEFAPLLANASISAFHIEVRSGRSWNAYLDPRTSEKRLWLRWEQGPTATILRPVDWECVVSAQIEDVSLTGEQLRSAVQEVRKTLPATAEGPITESDVDSIGTP